MATLIYDSPIRHEYPATRYPRLAAQKGCPMTAERTCVLVAGGVPAGAMAVALLAREGMEVILCEKDQFRCHNTENSPLTSTIPLLEFVGAAKRVESHGFVKKYGAYFRVKRDQPAGHIDFGRLPPHQSHYT